jgi:hypothetical protein
VSAPSLDMNGLDMFGEDGMGRIAFAIMESFNERVHSIECDVFEE